MPSSPETVIADFESPINDDNWSGDTGYLSRSSDVSYDGSYSALTTSSRIDSWWVEHNFDAEEMRAVSMWMHRDGWSSSNTVIRFGDGGSWFGRISVENGEWELANPSYNYVSTGVPVANESWQRLELRINSDQTQIKLRVYDSNNSFEGETQWISLSNFSGTVSHYYLKWYSDTNVYHDRVVARQPGPWDPENLTVTSSGVDAVDLSWDYGDTDSSNIDEFIIYKNAPNDSSFSEYDRVSGSTTTFSDTDINNGGDHSYQVSAINSDGESGPTNTATTTIDGTPAAPVNVSASVIADDQIDLDWDRGDGGLTADHFRVHIDRDGNGWTAPAGGPTTPSSRTATYGPSSDSSYDSQVGIDSSFQFRVRAENPDGESDWVTSGTVKTRPLPPHDISVSRPDANTIKIHGSVKSDISSKIRVNYREDTGSGYGDWQPFDLVAEGDTDQLTSGSVEAKGSDFTFTYEVGQSYPGYSGNPLQADARYQFRLRTWNDPNGDDRKVSDWVYADYGNSGNVYFEDDFESGDASAWDSWSGNVLSGSDATGISGADEGTYYGNFSDNDYAETTVDLSDTDPDSDVILRCAFATYTIDNDTDGVTITASDGATTEELKFVGWEYNKQEWVEIHAIIPESVHSASTTLRFDTDGTIGSTLDRVVVSDILHEYTMPAAPTGLSLDTSTDREITATWTNNDAFGIHQVHFKNNDGINDYEPPTPGNATSPYTITGLPDGDQFEVYIRPVVTQHRHGSQTDYWYDGSVDSGTKTAITNLPAVTNLTVESVDGRHATLSWTDPSNNTDGYRLLLREDDSGGYTQDGTEISPNWPRYWDRGGWSGGVTDIGAADGFAKVGELEAIDGNFDDLFTGSYFRDDFPDYAGDGNYIRLGFYAKWPQIIGWQSNDEWVVMPDPDPNQYQYYEVRADGSNMDSGEYFRMYYSTGTSGFTARIADPDIWKEGVDPPYHSVRTETTELLDGQLYGATVETFTEHTTAREDR